MRSRHPLSARWLFAAAAAFAVLLGLPSASAGAFNLHPGPNVPLTGPASNPGVNDIAIGRLTPDAHSEIVALYNGSVRTLIADGDGSFTDGGSYGMNPPDAGGSVFYRPAVELADFNGDTKLDVVTGATGQSLTPPHPPVGFAVLRLGQGDGSFGSPSYIPTGAPNAGGIAVANLDAGATADVVTADLDDGTVSVLLGNGNGTFSSATVHQLSLVITNAVAIGDVNDDAQPDIVGAGGGVSGVGASVALGNGDGTFDTALPITNGNGNGGRALAVADLNADGDDDVVTVNDGASTATVMLSDGDGTFQAADEYNAPSSPPAVAIDDYDGDAIPDLALAVSSGENRPVAVKLLSGRGDGTFRPPVDLFTDLGANVRTTALGSGALNPGAQPDLVVGNSGNADNGEFHRSVSIFASDNCPNVDNPDQGDADEDGLGDACDVSTSATVPDGGTLSSGEESTPADPVQASVTTPNGGLVSIDQQPPSGGPSPGFGFVGFQMNVEAPDASAAEPLELSFLLDAGLLPVPGDADSVEVYRDGTAIPACTGAPQAIPDPCVSSRTIDGDGDLTLTILSSHASIWEFAVADSDPPESTITKGPPNKLKKTKAKFSFEADEANAAFQCKLDNRAYAPCTSPKTMRANKGRHTFSVLATDGALNAEAEPATRSFKVVKK